ncbi:uncharacterized protein LOC116011713 isoform X2 [Ipomoea triloba]|uniref:uncharacterized protein LOC116011713 isoform X2 n=1 Tax=Ipomoea triloba TaxID=35885 RepID=UPI00125D8B5E|nr:uncharacterized protein LOC116011713 isoform X2 [Ipomoea triloba]
MILGGSSLHLNLSLLRLLRLLRLLHLIFTLAILDGLGISSVSASCDYSFGQNNKLYTYNLTSPISNFPHGVLSEDGFYRVAANGTVIWFQLCETMLFNHDPPMCVDCVDCGGGSRCGMGCSALASSIVGGYPVCSTLGRPSTTSISLIVARDAAIKAVFYPSTSELVMLIFFLGSLDGTDNNSPLRGIVVKTYHSALKNCSLAVSVVCDETATGPQTLEKVGTCDFTTELRHPSGCGRVISSKGKGLGWFGTLLIIILCLFGAYFLGGMIYRYFFLHIRGIDIIPNLEFWSSLPHRVQSWFQSISQRLRGPSQHHRSTYSPVEF